MKQQVALLMAALIVAVALELELTGSSKQQTVVAYVSEDQVFSEESKSTGPMNPLLAEKDSTFLEAGKIGLWTKSDAQSHFDDLAVSGK